MEEVTMTEMTERGKLVERVARAMCFGDSPSCVNHCDPDALAEPPHWKRGVTGDLNERMTNWESRQYMARAAIAECDKVLIESEDRNHDLVDTVLELEAQCAAMRRTLEFYADTRNNNIRLGESYTLAAVDNGARAQNALSPDAGRKVRDVVRASNYVLTAEDGDEEEAMRALERALSALGVGAIQMRKPKMEFDDILAAFARSVSVPTEKMEAENQGNAMPSNEEVEIAVEVQCILDGVNRGDTVPEEVAILADEISRLRTSKAELLEALKLATKELNAIRARDGAPQHIDWGKDGPMQIDGCSPGWWDELTEKCLSAIANAEKGT